VGSTADRVWGHLPCPSLPSLPPRHMSTKLTVGRKRAREASEAAAAAAASHRSAKKVKAGSGGGEGPPDCPPPLTQGGAVDAAKRWYDEKGGDAFGFEKGAFRMAMPVVAAYPNSAVVWSIQYRTEPDCGIEPFLRFQFKPKLRQGAWRWKCVSGELGTASEKLDPASSGTTLSVRRGELEAASTTTKKKKPGATTLSVRRDRLGTGVADRATGAAATAAREAAGEKKKKQRASAEIIYKEDSEAEEYTDDDGSEEEEEDDERPKRSEAISAVVEWYNARAHERFGFELGAYTIRADTVRGAFRNDATDWSIKYVTDPPIINTTLGTAEEYFLRFSFDRKRGRWVVAALSELSGSKHMDSDEPQLHKDQATAIAKAHYGESGQYGSYQMSDVGLKAYRNNSHAWTLRYRTVPDSGSSYSMRFQFQAVETRKDWRWKVVSMTTEGASQIDDGTQHGKYKTSSLGNAEIAAAAGAAGAAAGAAAADDSDEEWGARKRKPKKPSQNRAPKAAAAAQTEAAARKPKKPKQEPASGRSKVPRLTAAEKRLAAAQEANRAEKEQRTLMREKMAAQLLAKAEETVTVYVLPPEADELEYAGGQADEQQSDSDGGGDVRSWEGVQWETAPGDGDYLRKTDTGTTATTTTTDGDDDGGGAAGAGGAGGGGEAELEQLGQLWRAAAARAMRYRALESALLRSAGLKAALLREAEAEALAAQQREDVAKQAEVADRLAKFAPSWA
jgi:hypothetical protein